MQIFEGSTNRAINQKGFSIFMDNHKERSFNCTTDCPEYFTFALTVCEAIKKMKDSDFIYKNNEIFSVYYF